jgi:hypothetical protein
MHHERTIENFARIGILKSLCQKIETAMKKSKQEYHKRNAKLCPRVTLFASSSRSTLEA